MKRVAVIGGGPAGIVTLKYLLEAQRSFGAEEVEVRLYEYMHNIGGTFLTRRYEDAEVRALLLSFLLHRGIGELGMVMMMMMMAAPPPFPSETFASDRRTSTLVSSKQLTTFSDFRAKETGDFLKAVQYAQYLEDYVTHFKLWPHINLLTRVVEVRKRPEGGHTILYQRVKDQRHSGFERDTDGDVQEWDCDAVAVCSGLHVLPNMPKIPGLERVPEVLHSSQFKARSQFGKDKTVVVVGTGETGADVAHLAITSPTKRRNPGPVLLPCLGRKLNPNEPGIPIDVSRTNLFDTTYMHPILRNSFVLWEYYHCGWERCPLSDTPAPASPWNGRRGDGEKTLTAARTVFFNKTAMKICPYISGPYKAKYQKSWLYRIRKALMQTPIPEGNGRAINEDGTMTITNNGRPEYERLKDDVIKPDIMVFATGYSQSFPFFKAKGKDNKIEYPVPNEADVRNIWKRDEPDVGFIGFLRPGLGAIPPLAEMQAQLWVYNLLAGDPLSAKLRPEDEPHYRLQPLNNARIHYGVDHESYVYQLAMDMGSAPGVTDLPRILLGTTVYGGGGTLACGRTWFRMPIVWALGANFVTKFRLQGPWAWDGAKDMMASKEFWETITRRPYFFGHIVVNMLPLAVFGPMSFAVWCYATVMEVFAFLFGLQPGSGASPSGARLSALTLVAAMVLSAAYLFQDAIPGRDGLGSGLGGFGTGVGDAWRGMRAAAPSVGAAGPRR
ncbi:dimethylaniline monooxygenase [Purpureocillium lilacinum]|uniref:Dimethylaniline monooxygenase n=1 Tax=Purpureocillium lilacinum TaxID=33203 RepID=A0A2U3ER03_PURLI|nr:dimethylaniline monooxygenase [Purpureocillium lilacinum]